jgi:hypothetical protein
MDVGNPLVGPHQTLLDLGRTRGPDGTEYLVLTLRQGGVTFTAMLTKAEAREWWQGIKGSEEKMSGITVAGAGLPPGLLNGHGPN